MMLSVFAPAVEVGAKRYNLSDNGIWSYQTGITPEVFSSNQEPCGIEEYLVEVNPSLELTDSAKAAIERLQTKTNQLIDQIAEKAGIARDIIEDAVNKAIAGILSGAGNLDVAIDDLLTNTLPGVIEDVVYRLSLPSATREATNAFNAQEAGFLTQATQDAATWQAAVDAYEAPGGIVSQITTATNSFNNVLSGNATLRGIFSALNVPDPVTNDWMIDNISRVSGVIGDVNCNMFILLGSSTVSACNTIKSDVKTISDNLSEYQAYKNLLANQPADPAAWALEQTLSNTPGCDITMTKEACIAAVANKKAQDQADAMVIAYQLALPTIKSYVPSVQDAVQNAIDEIATALGIAKDEANTILQMILGYDPKTPIDLSLSTFVEGQRIGGDFDRNLTISELVDLLMGRTTLDSYTVSIPADAFGDDNTVTLNNRIGLRLGHTFVLLGQSENTITRVCKADPQISPVITNEDLTVPATGIENAGTSDSLSALVALLSVLLLGSVGIVRARSGSKL